jgi:hypothetical protein
MRVGLIGQSFSIACDDGMGAYGFVDDCFVIAGVEVVELL